jgi:hypothetical protein
MPVSRSLLARLSRAADPALDPPAFVGLGQVDWSAVKHAHGKATDVPVLLRAAASDDPDAREEAFELLSETIWHQGTVYSATPLVVPFLYRMLEADETPEKVPVALLLATIAGNSLTGTGKNLAACRRAVEERLELLYPYLRDPEWGVRQAVAQAIGQYPEACVRLLADLEIAYRKESNKAVRLALAGAVGQSPEGAARVLPDLQAELSEAPDEWQRQAYQNVIRRITQCAERGTTADGGAM